jgi:hypothetical protein
MTGYLKMFSTTLLPCYIRIVGNCFLKKNVKKKVNFINSSRNEGLSSPCTALSFKGFGSISWHSPREDPG